MRRKEKDNGFSLLEIVVVISVVAILAGLLVPLLFRTLEVTKESATKGGLETLKKAILGDPTLIQNGVRSDYGYIGDLGKMPGEAISTLGGADKLKELSLQNGQPPHQFFSEFLIGAGWQGPYAMKGAQPAMDITSDGFGWSLLYEAKAPTGLTSDAPVATITSIGADGVTSGDDISVQVLKREAYGDVSGLVKTDKSGHPVPFVPVTFVFPDGRLKPDANKGILVEETVRTDEQGRYEFADIPFGARSLIVKPRLVLAPGSAIRIDKGEKIKFTVTNFSAFAANITAVTVTYSTEPPAFFKELKIGGKTVFKATKDTCAGSGQTLGVSPAIAVAGSGKTFTPILIHVDTPQTLVPDILVAERLKRGGSIEVKIEHFRDACKGGKKVDLTGVPMTVIFDHGDNEPSVVDFVATARHDHDDDNDENEFP